jgi:lipopolysaccharide transport system ATP-binding protein
MTDIAIRVEYLSKRYRIGLHERYKTLRDTLVDATLTPFRRSKIQRESDSWIWALEDICFQVKQGEALGIIGRNGAGKSTLLKILARITEPTKGRVEIRGRVGTLLEVGTGFHPELTGRENIYLSGAILGMKKNEIDRKFDEIVAFAEVEKFIDTTVKHYSSGMYMRLAFAVAAHLEPEILLVDEVLAVGDAAFQKKCLGKMSHVTKEGRTVLFVSHNLGSLANLCPRAILLVQGKKHSDGASGDVISEYIALGKQSYGERVWQTIDTAPGNENARLHAVRIVSGGQVTSDVDIQDAIEIQIEFWNLKPEARIATSIHLLDQMGAPVLASANMHSVNLIRDEWYDKPHTVGLYRAVCTLPGNFLNEGRYGVNAIILMDVTLPQVLEREVVSFTVHDTGAMRKEFGGQWIGVVRPKLAWQTSFLGPFDTVSSQESNP